VSVAELVDEGTVDTADVAIAGWSDAGCAGDSSPTEALGRSTSQPDTASAPAMPAARTMIFACMDGTCGDGTTTIYNEARERVHPAVGIKRLVWMT
jgi:hypothetical protein